MFKVLILQSVMRHKVYKEIKSSAASTSLINKSLNTEILKAEKNGNNSMIINKKIQDKGFLS
jgi:hypothetical protein